MSEESFKYYAFVSYRSSDEKWAKWLQEKIEAYRLPTTIQHAHNDLPKGRLRPCFRYHTDIQPNELKTELRNKLEQSKYLLVICSPRSAQSPWVGAEIDTFVELGRRDRIIPVIVEGRPYSNDPQTECFNPSLLRHFPHSDNINDDREILGVNIHEEGAGSAYMKRERAVIQIVSRMLGVGFDQLWQRQRRRIRRRIILSCLAVAAVIAAVVATWRINQPFDTIVQVTQSEAENTNLPALHDAVITLQLPDEQRRDTLHSLDGAITFRYVPARLKGQTVAMSLIAPDFVPLDTTVTLTETLILPVRRDENRYGRLSALVINPDGKLQTNTPIYIEGVPVRTDNTGRFTHFVPLSDQRTTYTVTSADGRQTTVLHAPCGPNDIIIL